jgi:GNAT superfamily N-acetyltransferase
MTVVLRSGSNAEAELLEAIQEAASEAALRHIFPPENAYPREAIVEHWRRFPGEIVVAERDGRAIGVAGTDACWLQGLYVVPEEWGTGVAAVLHDDALRRVRAGGCAQARLWCLEDNRRARRFYERRGWRLVEETRVVPYPPHPIDVSYALDLP